MCVDPIVITVYQHRIEEIAASSDVKRILIHLSQSVTRELLYAPEPNSNWLLSMMSLISLLKSNCLQLIVNASN